MNRVTTTQTPPDKTFFEILGVDAHMRDLAKIEDGQTRLARVTALIANRRMVDINTHRMATYTDKAGKTSTGPMGLMVQVNIHIKKEFGFEVNDGNSVTQDKHLSIVRDAVSELMLKAEKEQQPRKYAKQDIYEMIALHAALYHATVRRTGVE